MELDAFLADAGIEIAAVTPLAGAGGAARATGASAGGGTRRG